MDDLKNTTEMESASKAAFQAVRTLDVAPSPFLKSRVLNQLKDRRRQRREVIILRLVSVMLAATCAVILAVHLGAVSRRPGEISFVNQNYVINLDLRGDQLKVAKSVEVELPDGVQFVSKHPDVVKARSLRLALAHIPSHGDLRLPFVVRSNSIGTKILKLRVFDHSGAKISEHDLKVSFRNKNSETL